MNDSLQKLDKIPLDKLMEIRDITSKRIDQVSQGSKEQGELKELLAGLDRIVELKVKRVLFNNLNNKEVSND